MFSEVIDYLQRVELQIEEMRKELEGALGILNEQEMADFNNITEMLQPGTWKVELEPTSVGTIVRIVTAATVHDITDYSSF